MMENEERQKDIFLASEADAWYERNREALARRDFASDALCGAVMELAGGIGEVSPSILEVGCGEGLRLAWLAERLRGGGGKSTWYRTFSQGHCSRSGAWS
jgi:hypothetical protein